jgi:3-phosphoshikimate 1-carboxyvinyltransferase
MNFENSPSKINSLKSFSKIIKIDSSKSYSNRALIVAALTGNQMTIKNLSNSTDVVNLLHVFKKIGLDFKLENKSITFFNSFPACEKNQPLEEIILETGDGGTTNRFLIPFLARGKKTYRLNPTERMSERPINELVTPLREMGVEIVSDEQSWMTIKGPANLNIERDISIDSSKSSQFISAMNLAFFDKEHIRFKALDLRASSLYIEITKFVISKMQTSQKNEFVIPIDFSSLAFPLCLAIVLKGQLLVTNAFELDSLQADSSLLSLVKNLGTSIKFDQDGLHVKNAKMTDSFDFDFSLAPDLFPALVFLAAHSNGVSTFYNLEVLEYKESDRVDEMLKILNVFKVKYDYNRMENNLLIHGGVHLESSDSLHIKTARDHRVVMSAAMFLACHGGGYLYNLDCVNKSYSDFLDLLTLT